MFVPAWAWKAAPYVAGAALAGMAYIWAYSNGREAERAIWRQREAKAAAAASAREDALQEQVDAASIALSMSTAENERLSKQTVGSVRNYYVTKPDSDVSCLDPDVLRAIQESDAPAKNTEAAR